MPESEWRSLSDLPNGPAMRVVIRTKRDPGGTTWRWLPYKPGSRMPYVGGRWQIATEHGWRNEIAPTEGEWKAAA